MVIMLLIICFFFLRVFTNIVPYLIVDSNITLLFTTIFTSPFFLSLLQTPRMAFFPLEIYIKFL